MMTRTKTGSSDSLKSPEMILSGIVPTTINSTSAPHGVRNPLPAFCVPQPAPCDSVPRSSRVTHGHSCIPAAPSGSRGRPLEVRALSLSRRVPQYLLHSMSTGTTQHSSSCSADSPQSFTSQTSIILSQCQDNFTSAVQNTDVDPVKSIPNEVVLPSIDILIQCLPIEKQSVLFPPHPEQVFPTYFQQQSLHQQVHFSDSTKSRDTSFVLCQQAQTLASVLSETRVVRARV